METPSIKITEDNTTEITCSCGHNIFRQGFRLRNVSKLLTGEAEDAVITVPTVICDKCGTRFEKPKAPEPSPIIV